MSGNRREPDWIPYARQSISESDVKAVVSTLRSDFITQGPRIEQFEDALSEYSGARYAVAVSSGTAALHLAFKSLGIQKGESGIVPAITFVATANALHYCDAKPWFCDVDPDSGLANVTHFDKAIRNAEAIGEKVKVLVPVSFTGRMCDLESISSLAGKKGAIVVEDAAHSLGAVQGGFNSGSCEYSDAAILSFHPVKHICSGEGGAILTNDKTLARRARRLRSHGIEKPKTLRESVGGWAYSQIELGWNYRMTDLQASLGLSQLDRIGTFLRRRSEIVSRYQKAFGVDPFTSCFERPIDAIDSSWHLYVVRFRSSELRRGAYDFLRENRIGSQVHYIPVFRHPYYSDFDFSSCMGAEKFYSGCLSLPLYPSLSNLEQDRVIDSLKRYCESI